MRIPLIMPETGPSMPMQIPHFEPFPSAQSEIIEDIKQKAIGPEAWKKFLGVRMEKYELDDKILEFLLEQDAFDPNQLNYMTHLPPIFMPRTLKEKTPKALKENIPRVHRHRFEKCIGYMRYNLGILNKLVQKPLKGHPSRIDFSLLLSDIDKPQSEHAYWLVARKELVARELSTSEQIDYMKRVNEKTHAGYEELPSVLDLSTVALVNRVVTGDRHLADPDSEPRSFLSLSRCKETVKVKSENQHVVVGSHTHFDSQKSRGGLLVAYIPSDSKSNNIGVAAVKKVPASKRLKKLNYE